MLEVMSCPAQTLRSKISSYRLGSISGKGMSELGSSLFFFVLVQVVVIAPELCRMLLTVLTITYRQTTCYTWYLPYVLIYIGQ